jgi:Family of unknown function (DUF5946)
MLGRKGAMKNSTMRNAATQNGETDAKCSGCGLLTAGGKVGCRAIFDELLAREWNDPTSYRCHRMFVDAYCLQHPDEFCASAKSFAAHLTGLCAAVEHKSHPSVLKAVNRWLSSGPGITKPQLPAFRGALTIAEVQAEQDLFPIAQAVDRWARTTWQAYAEHHGQARAWIEQAFSAK